MTHGQSYPPLQIATCPFSLFFRVRGGRGDINTRGMAPWKAFNSARYALKEVGIWSREQHSFLACVVHVPHWGSIARLISPVTRVALFMLFLRFPFHVAKRLPLFAGLGSRTGHRTSAKRRPLKCLVAVHLGVSIFFRIEQLAKLAIGAIGSWNVVE